MQVFSLFIIFYSFTFLPSISHTPLSALSFRSLQSLSQVLLPIHVHRPFNIRYLECFLKSVNVLLEHGVPAKVLPYTEATKRVCTYCIIHPQLASSGTKTSPQMRDSSRAS